MAPRKSKVGGRMGHLVPLVVLTGYMAYVLTDRFEDHNARREQIDNDRKEKQVAAAKPRREPKVASFSYGS